MSSWTGGSGSHRLTQDRIAYCLKQDGFTSNFLQFFLWYLYAKHHKQKLYINDTSNSISTDYNLLFDTFILDPLVIKELTATVQEKIKHKMIVHILTYSFEDLRARARIFQFTPTILAQIASRNTCPPIDCGLHIRAGDKITTGEMRPIAIKTYIDAVPKDARTLYIMTDSQQSLAEFRAAAPSTWTLYALTPPIPFTQGHVQADFNAQNHSLKLEAYYHFLTELYILQNAISVICTFSSNIGRFLALTSKGTVKSLDAKFALV